MWHCSFLLFFLRFPGAAWLQPLVLCIVRVHLLWRSKGQKKLGTKFTFIEHLGCFHLRSSWCLLSMLSSSLFVNRRLAASGKHNQPGKAWTAPFPGIEDTFEVDSKSKVLCCEQNVYIFKIHPNLHCLTTWYYKYTTCDYCTLHVTTVFLLRPNVCPISFCLWFLQRSKKSRPRRSSPDGRFHRPLVTRRVSVWNLRMSGLARRQKWPPGEFEARIPQPWTRIISRLGSQYQNTGFHQTPAWIYSEHPGTHVHRRTIWFWPSAMPF